MSVAISRDSSLDSFSTPPTAPLAHLLHVAGAISHTQLCALVVKKHLQEFAEAELPRVVADVDEGRHDLVADMAEAPHGDWVAIPIPIPIPIALLWWR